MAHLTVSDVARRIAEPGEDLPAVIERLRSWTKLGVLRADGKRNPGTGRRRRYSERAVIEAAILSKLSSYFGIWAPRVPLFDGALDLAGAAAVEAAERNRRGQVIYLVIGVAYDDQPADAPGALPLTLVSELVYVNAEKASAPTNPKLPKALRSHRAVGLPDRMEIAIVINLTSLFVRIQIPIEVDSNG